MSFREQLRLQLAAESEGTSVARMRSCAAALNVVGGIIGLGLVLQLAWGRLSWLTAPGCVLLVAGGVLGVLVQVTRNVGAARRRLLWAWGCTLPGFLLFAVFADVAPS